MVAIEAMLDEIEQCQAAGFECIRSKQIVPDNRLHHWRRSEVEGCGSEHSECGLARIDFAKFASGYSLRDQASEVFEERLKIFTRDPFNLGRGVHRFPLHQARIVRMRRKEIEVPIDP